MKRYPPSGPSSRQAQPVTHTHHEFEAGDGSEQLLAALGYLGVIFFSFLPALLIYLFKGRSAPGLRYHAAQAVNVAVAVILFDLCAVIAGAMLALDAVAVSLSIVVPLATALWLVTVAYLVRIALATARGQRCELPRWLHVDLLR